MEDKKGFTLIELLAVITLIALLSLLIVPSILNLVNRNETKLSSTTQKLIFNATETYLDSNQTEYIKVNGAVYCPTIQNLIDNGFFNENLVDIETGEKFDASLVIKSSYNGYKYEYEIIDASGCTVNKPDTSKGMIAIGDLNYYRGSISSDNKKNDIFVGVSTIVQAIVNTSLKDGTELKFSIRRGSNIVTNPVFTSEKITVNNNKATLTFTVPNNAKVGEYVVELSSGKIKGTKNFTVKYNPIILFMGD